MVGLLLANRFPLLLWWGPDYVQIYNDAYRPIPGAKHPRSMGQPARECWAEIWHILQPLIDTPYRGGPATWNDDILLEVNRHGFLEETHFTIAYSPVPDATAPGGIGGVLATVPRDHDAGDPGASSRGPARSRRALGGGQDGRGSVRDRGRGLRSTRPGRAVRAALPRRRRRADGPARRPVPRRRRRRGVLRPRGHLSRRRTTPRRGRWPRR